MSADKSTLLKTFNTQFFALLDDLLLIFPDNIDIATGRKSFETIKRANPTILIKVWLSHYIHHIANRLIMVMLSILLIKTMEQT